VGQHNTLSGYLKSHLGRVHAGDYVALLAYMQRNEANTQALTAMRTRIRDKTHAATCLGFGPRFQHSTGQAYKGGPNSGVFLQITCDDPADIDVPGHSYSFGVVKGGTGARRSRGAGGTRPARAARPPQGCRRRASGVGSRNGCSAPVEALLQGVKQMQIGVIGLGRMGGNMSRRLMKAGHRCVVFDADVKTREALAKEGAAAAGSLAEVVKALGEKPRAVWVMLPAGLITEATVERLGGLREPDDIIIDGGNSFYKDDIRRAKKLAGKGIRYVDCGTSGGVWGAESWHDHLYDMLKGFVGNAAAEFDVDRIDEAAWKRLAEKMTYVQGDLTTPELYEKIRGTLGEAEKTHGTQGNAIFYLAVADRFFGPVVEQLGRAKLTNQDEDKNGKHQFWRRVVIEKPFGHSLDSARDLNARILRTLHEDQIFRIDHFLGKDTVQSIMAFRFANGLFEPIWNRDRIDHVQITVAETVGVEQRGKFYEQTGSLRDMVPNHVFTLLSMVAMEPPVGFDAASIRTKKAEVFAAMPSVKPARAVRGQYGAGTVLGKQVNAYRKVPNVAADSNIETYVAMQLEIDNWRWAGVPFYFRTGKHMSQRNTEIAIRFKQAPYAAFQDTPVDTLRPNWLVLRIAPDEGISLQFEVKRPGPVVDLAAVRMDFHYDDWFPKEPNVGYETLIYDVMIGDPTLFMRAGTVVATLSKLLNIPPAQIATIGDMPNDVLMFRYSGFSIAMGNSGDEVKAQASAVTDSNDNEGFAKAVRKFILRPASA
jgi:glucose-6-phosphate 1-dehydrogenase